MVVGLRLGLQATLCAAFADVQADYWPGAFSHAVGSADLRPPRLQRIPTGHVQPQGWLRAQSELQAAALTSHLPLFWPQVANTSWLGGHSDVDGGLHESTPYWLNGATPLAIQLNDTTLLDKVEAYINDILARQTAEGWLGPDTNPSDFWSRFPFILALVQYHEWLRDSLKKGRVLKSAIRFLDAVAGRLASGKRLVSWSSARAHDLIWAIHYFVDVLKAAPDGPHDDVIVRLLGLAARLHHESIDWNKWFNSTRFPRHAVILPTDFSHGVNNAQAIKHGVVWARQSPAENATVQGAAESWLAWEMLMRYHGQPNGVFAADEHLAGRMPSRGAELCTVVETMWSLALLAQVAPTDSQAVPALDALEKLAFNALPGSLSDDLWSHPYLQFANSFQAVHNEKDHVWTHDGPDSAMYGLAPQYECCTANFHQGYPKFIAHLFLSSPSENMIVSTVWAPSSMRVPEIGGGVHIELRTDYPFGLKAEYVIKNPEAFKLKIRLPEFLRDIAGPHEGLATVRVWIDGRSQTVQLVDGFLMYQIAAWPLPEPRVAVRLEWEAPPKLHMSDVPEQGASIFIGPLLMALDLGEHRKSISRYAFEAADWDTTATLRWRYGLASSSSVVFGNPVRTAPGIKPYRHSSDGCPVIMNATLLRVPDVDWPVDHNAPGPLPVSGRLSPPPATEHRLLLPYGCSSIRIAAFPVLEQPVTIV